MAPPTATTTNLSDRFADDIVSHTVDLHRYSESVRRKVLAHLYELEQELSDKVDTANLAGISRQTLKLRRTEALLRQTRGTIATAYSDAEKTNHDELLELADLENKAVTRLLNKRIGGSVFTTSMTRKDLKALVNEQTVLGGPATDWWSKQANDLQFKFAQQMRLGVSAAETNDQLIRRVRGTATGRYIETVIGGKTKKVREFTGGIMQVSTREASALVRTSVQTVSNQVMKETYEENKDVLRGQQYLATLDLRTCPRCFPLDKASFDFEGNLLEDSPVKGVIFPGTPPIHFACRCVFVPIIKSWEQLIEEQTGKKLKVLEGLPSKVRASMDGEVAGDLTYNDWLKGKSEAQQKEVLGLGKWELWQKGDITSAQLLDQSGRPLTLEQLKERS